MINKWQRFLILMQFAILLRRAGNTGIKSADDPPDGLLQFEVDPIRGDIALPSHLEGPFDGQHVMHCGDDEFCVFDDPGFHRVVMDQGAAWGFDKTIALTVFQGVGYGGIFIIQVMGEHFNSPFKGIDQLDPAAEVEQQDGVGGLAEGVGKSFQIFVCQRGSHRCGQVDARQAVRSQHFAFITGLSGIGILCFLVIQVVPEQVRWEAGPFNAIRSQNADGLTVEFRARLAGGSNVIGRLIVAPGADPLPHCP